MEVRSHMLALGVAPVKSSSNPADSALQPVAACVGRL